MHYQQRRRQGFYLPLILTFAVVAFIVTSAILTIAYSNFHLVKHQSNSNSALNIAEAGVNYYLWHLSHNNKDYCDGQTCVGSGPYGPFTHEFRDSYGNVVGSYQLTITPPPPGGSVVSIKAEGINSTGEKRSVVAEMGIPSFSRYSMVTNSEIYFGSTEQTKGLVHSNAGIRFDGTSDNIVSSAVETYTPSTCFGGNGSTVRAGVWGSGGPTSFWQYPVPQVDFNQITSDFDTLQRAANLNGVFLPTLVDTHNPPRKTYSGYAIKLKANGFQLGRVTAKNDGGGISSGCVKHSSYDSLIQSVIWEGGDRALPTNGVIYVADNLWIWSDPSSPLSSKLTVASARLPDNASTNTNIFLQNDIRYAAYDGTVKLGLLSQSDMVVNSDSEDDLRIDAYLLSQKGHVFRPCYSGRNNCNLPITNKKSIIYIYGGVGSNTWWTWSYESGGTVISGYQTTVQEYDNYLALDPPPLFPITGVYAILSWKEEPIL